MKLIVAFGNGGFGYAPYFFLPEAGCTVAACPTRKKTHQPPGPRPAGTAGEAFIESVK